MHEGLNQVQGASGQPKALITGTSVKDAADILFALLLDVVRKHEPEIAPVLMGGANIAKFTPERMARVLQVQGIWFQLLAIAEQNAAMRRRRHGERTRGRASLRGTFDYVVGEAARSGAGPRDVESLIASLRIRPVITAHPTESKRVTVLEKYRRIYLLLRELEMERWTERERRAVLDDVRDQIELVWMTGELHLEKPTVQHEVSRGLHFFDEALFEMAPQMLALLDNALAEHYPGERFRLPPFFQFGSWIGGDRDGNPWVTTEVTAWTLQQNALTSLRNYRARIVDLAKALSITERALPVAESFRAELDDALDATGEADAIRTRNPGEPYRQFLTTVLRKLDGTIVRIQSGAPAATVTPMPTSLLPISASSSSGSSRPIWNRWRRIWCGRCGGLSRSSASPPCGSISARTPPRRPRRCARCGGRRRSMATRSRRRSAARSGGNGFCSRYRGRAAKPVSRTCHKRPPM